METNQITPRVVLTELRGLATAEGKIEDHHAAWKLAASIGITAERMYGMVCKLKRLGYLEDRVVLIAPGTTRVWMFVTDKQLPN